MIAAATHVAQVTTPWWNKLSFNWFDVALILVLAFGFWRGRKRGMSREALPTTMWLVAVVGAGFGYELLGQMLVQTGYVKKIFGTSVNERTAAFVISYLFIALVAFIVYCLLKKVFKEKLSGNNTFGSGEYYLGMMAGVIRYACILIFVLALMNAPFYSLAEIAAKKAYNNRWYGGGMKDYSGDFIPSFDEVQASVFKDSIMGPAIKNNLSMLLITGTGPVKKTASTSH